MGRLWTPGDPRTPMQDVLLILCFSCWEDLTSGGWFDPHSEVKGNCACCEIGVENGVEVLGKKFP